MATETTGSRPGWLLLDCAVQNYAWGKKGTSSVVAKLRKSSDDFIVDPELPYAELWMGTHAKGPSTIRSPDSLKGKSLKEWLSSNSWALGKATDADGGLPFLFKVLSINKPLSIQAHPTKDHAKVLHGSAPDKYPDSNHKPEMAIAVSEFEAFCGFRPISDLVRGLENVPELFNVVGARAAENLIKLHRGGLADDSQEMKEALKECFSAFINQDEDIFKAQLSSLISRIESNSQNKLG
jgi:mannose-6-phosphate isomerase